MSKSTKGAGQFSHFHSTTVSGPSIIDRPRSLKLCNYIIKWYRLISKLKNKNVNSIDYYSMHLSIVNLVVSINKLCVSMFTLGLWEWEESPLEASKGFQRLVGLFDDFIKVSSFNLKL